MRDFWQGFLAGARETPLAYFAPAVAIWRLLLATTESLIRSSERTDRGPHEPA